MQRIFVNKPNLATVDLLKSGVMLESATYTGEWQGENSILMALKTRVKLDIARGDYVEHEDERYYLLSDIKRYDRKSEEWKIIEITLYAPYMFLSLVQFRNTAADLSRARDDVPQNGNLYSLAQIVVNNLNRFFGAGTWQLGEYPAGTLPVEINFVNQNCLAVVNQLCDKWDTWYTIEIVNDVFVLHFGKDAGKFPESLQYGIGKGLIKLELEHLSPAPPVTKLTVLGSTRNLPIGYRDYGNWRLMLPEVYLFSEIVNPVAVAEHGACEDTIINEDIYPHRTGMVSDIISGDIYSFIDISMTPDIQVTEGAQVCFLTGNLGGTTFDVAGYDPLSKRFVLHVLTDANNFHRPNSSAAFQIQRGDTYVLVGIALPQSYVTAAERELEAWGLAKYEAGLQPKATLSINTESSYLQGAQEIICPGQEVLVQATEIGLDKYIRVRRVVKNLLLNRRRYKYDSIELSDIEAPNTTKALLERIAESSGAAGRDATDKDTALPDNYTFIRKLIANELFVKKLVANDGFIDKLVTSEAFITNLSTSEAFIKKLIVDKLQSSLGDRWFITIDSSDNHIRLFKKNEDGSTDDGNMLAIALNDDKVAQVNITQGGYQTALHSKGLNISKYNSHNNVSVLFAIVVNDTTGKVDIKYADRQQWPDESQAGSGGLYRNNSALASYDEPRIKR